MSDNSEADILRHYMQRNPRWFYPQELIDSANKWLQAIDRGDNLAILFFPRADRPRRLDQFLHDSSIRSYKLKRKTVFFVLSLEMAEDSEELKDTITRQLNASSFVGRNMTFDEWIRYLSDNAMWLVFILSEAEKYMNPYGKIVLGVLSDLTLEYEGVISVLSLYEANITHPAYLTFLPTTSRLLQSLFYYPLYSRDDSERLIQYLQDRWSGSFTSRQREDVLTLCGGHPWLLAEAVRQMATNGVYSFEDESMIFRVRTIFSMLTEMEQDTLMKRLVKKTTLTREEKISYEYFERMGIIDKKGVCAVGYFERYLRHHYFIPQTLGLSSEKIVLNGVLVDRIFSPKERRIIKLLLTKEGIVVGRDEIAKHLWPVKTEEHYSDWAIDALIARLRKRLEQLSLAPSMLKVVRGKGYLLTTSKT